MKEKIMVFDTTLRDGLQPVQKNIFANERLAIARNLADMGVDVIEAGFPYSSAANARAVRLISEELGTEEGPIIAGLSRANQVDIQANAKALEKAKNPRIHTFIATSDIHILKKYERSREWVIDKTIESVRFARKFVDDIQFSLEDFGRSDINYAIEVSRHAIDEGATIINLPDTVGYLQPEEYAEKVGAVIGKLRSEGYDAIFSVHTHNDLGLATANTLAGLKAGARQAEVTVNGIGERAGNSALEELVGILNTRGPKDNQGHMLYTDIDSRYIGSISKHISGLTGMLVQPNKAIVGKNAFAHSSGIHVHGFLKNKETYEIMEAKDYGMESYIGQTAQSGKAGHKEKFNRIGVQFHSEEEFQKASQRYTEIADRLRFTDDADFILAATGENSVPQKYRLNNYHPVVESTNGPVVGVALKLYEDDYLHKGFEEGNGPIDAAVLTIKGFIGRDYMIKDFHVSSTEKGSASGAGAQTVATKNGWEVTGHANSTDIVKCAIESYIDACNRLRYIEDYFAETKQKF